MKKIWIYLRPFLKPKFIISYSIPFMLVNGWAWIGSSLFAIGWVNWFTIAAVTWLGILWLPWTPEKLVTIPVAIWIHTRLFRNDAATRAQLDAMYAEAVKDWSRVKGWFKRKDKKGEEEKDGKGLSEAKSTRGEKIMKKNKIAVYTIAKNEIDYVDKFMASMIEADAVYVLDTGSTDGTVEKLREWGATVFEKTITPWDFSKARNAALKLVPKKYNVLVSVDLDEVFDPGWAEWLRDNWDDEMGMMRYFYVATHEEDGSPGMVFYRDKIHLNDYAKYHWKYSIHEVLTRPANQPIYYTNNIVCHHWQNPNTNRKNYLDLLEKEYKKNPNDIRNIHLLGREYFIYEQYEDAIDVLSNMRQFESTYTNEVADAYTYIGKSYHMLGDLDQAAAAFKRGAKCAPHLRGNLLDLANIYIQQGRFGDALLTIGEALKITERYLLWADDPASWREKPYVIAFQAFMGMSMRDEAVVCIEEIERVYPTFPLLEKLKLQLEKA